jgi:ATP-binding cassette subfamily F protein 3
LDIETKELLKNAIRDFEGTTIIVSHDREFVSGVASRILYLAQDKRWIDHIGSLETFFEKYPEFVRHAEGHALPSQAPKTTEQKKQNQPRLSFEERKKVKNAIRSLEKKIAAVESEIEKFSPEKDELHKKIELSASPEDAQSLWDRVTEIDRRIHLLMVDWEKWGSELEILNRKFGEGSED